MALVTYALSGLLISVDIFLAKYKGGSFVIISGKLSTASLTIGVLSLSLLLLSPLGELVPKIMPYNKHMQSDQQTATRFADR